MGFLSRLFGSHEEEASSVFQDIPTEEVVIPENIARVIPDAGEHFLWWLGVEGPALEEVAAHVNALRGENGWISLDKAGQFGIAEYENGPLTFLTQMTVFDSISTVPIWASYGSRPLKGADERTVRQKVEIVAREQGHAAAATWAIAARPEAQLDLEFLAAQLVGGWEKQLELYYRRHVLKAFKKWQR